MFGYSGKILYINMNAEKDYAKGISEEFCKKYIGGIGFVTRLLYDNTKAKIDPLSPDNTMVFAVGPFAGTLISIGDKYGVGAKSPLTGFLGDSLGGSFWSHELKKAGFDALVIQGRADKPTYLFIDDDIIEFRDAKSLWGKSYFDTQRLIREELGDENVRVSSIGGPTRPAHPPILVLLGSRS